MYKRLTGPTDFKHRFQDLKYIIEMTSKDLNSQESKPMYIQ